jgi:hypothetical protein
MTMGYRPSRSVTALFAARSKPVTNSGRGWVRTSDLSRVKQRGPNVVCAFPPANRANRTHGTLAETSPIRPGSATFGPTNDPTAEPRSCVGEQVWLGGRSVSGYDCRGRRRAGRGRARLCAGHDANNDRPEQIRLPDLTARVLDVMATPAPFARSRALPDMADGVVLAPPMPRPSDRTSSRGCAAATRHRCRCRLSRHEFRRASVSGPARAPENLRTRQRERRGLHRGESSGQQIVVEKRGRLDGRRRGQLADQRG